MASIIANLSADGLSVPNILLAIPALLAAYILAGAIYSITLHPLADFPGPKLCAISRIPYWRACISGTDVQWLHKLHSQHGPVVRFGPTDLSYTAAEAWQDIHGREKGGKENPKAADFSVQPINGVPSMLTASPKDHERVRRLFSPAFSERALRRQEPVFRKYVQRLVAKMHELVDDVAILLNFTTFDLMADLCFGHPLGLLSKNEFSPWVRSIFDSLQMLPYVSMINHYPHSKTIFDRFQPRSVTEQRITHCKHAEDRVNQRLEEGSSQPDIWNLVMEAQDSDHGLSLEEMHSNAELFMLAGSETTATLLAGALYYLLTNPKTMKLLATEIRNSSTSVEGLSFDSLASLKYLNACLKEALRIYPPVPLGSPRVIPEGGQIILGKWVPAHTYVSVHHWSTYHSESNFKNAESFVPERWLGNTDDDDDAYAYANDAKEAHQPFAWVPRNCLGQNMAMHEVRLILATVLFTFDLELCDESRQWSQQKAFALWAKQPLMCRVKSTMA